MNQLCEQTTGQDLDDHHSDDPADHVAWAAETLASMSGSTANAISTTQHVTPADLLVLRRVLPSLAARYGFGARIDSEGDHVTVRFVRPRTGKPASVPD